VSGAETRSPLWTAEAGISGAHDESGPVFREAWEAQAFALVLSLHKGGVFTWPEWTAVLSAEIRRAQSAGDPDTGETYYHHWLAALERIVIGKGLTTASTLTRYRDAWEAAASRTPHGKPIELGPSDFASKPLGAGDDQS
jgi:nitrile hydratase accessory protein